MIVENVRVQETFVDKLNKLERASRHLYVRRFIRSLKPENFDRRVSAEFLKGIMEIYKRKAKDKEALVLLNHYCKVLNSEFKAKNLDYPKILRFSENLVEKANYLENLEDKLFVKYKTYDIREQKEKEKEFELDKSGRDSFKFDKEKLLKNTGDALRKVSSKLNGDLDIKNKANKAKEKISSNVEKYKKEISKQLNMFRKHWGKITATAVLVAATTFFSPKNSDLINYPTIKKENIELNALIKSKIMAQLQIQKYKGNVNKLLDNYVVDNFGVLINKKTGIPVPPKGYKFLRKETVIMTGYTPRGRGLMAGNLGHFDDGKTSIGKDASILDGIAVNSSKHVTFKNSEGKIVKEGYSNFEIPYGYIVYIPGVGMKIADDTGGRMKNDALKGKKHIDVRVGSFSDAWKLTRKNKTIYIFGTDDKQLAFSEYTAERLTRY